MKHLAAIAFLALAPLAPAHASSSSEPGTGLGIAAVVGGEAISSYDVENRLRFVIVTAKMSNTIEVVKQLRPQVLRQLIDEKLQVQEAARNGIEPTDKEVAEAILGIEAQRGMPPGAISRMLEHSNVPVTTFTDQIRAQIAWGKLMQKKIRPTVKISEEEIALAQKKFSVPAVKQELQIAVLALPVDKPQRDGEIRQLADRLVRELRSGASFEEVSRQFSSSATAGKFWVRPEQLDKAVAKSLATAKAGTITDATRTETGYTIVKVYDTRAIGGEQQKLPQEEEVVLKEILLKLKPDADVKEADILLQIGEEVAKHPGTCEEKGVASISEPDLVDIAVDYRRARMMALPPALKIIAENLKVGDISSPFASSEGIRLYMLCERGKVAPEPVDRERVANMLLSQKMELEAQKYIRDLRRDAFVEVR